MTKAELVAEVAKELNSTKTMAEKLVDAFIGQVSSGLLEKGKVALTDFGILEVVKRKEKKGRNPQTGKEITIKAHKTVRFKPAKALKDTIN